MVDLIKVDFTTAQDATALVYLKTLLQQRGNKFISIELLLKVFLKMIPYKMKEKNYKMIHINRDNIDHYALYCFLMAFLVCFNRIDNVSLFRTSLSTPPWC